MQDIAQRYIIPGETAESALLFLPSEAVYAELHANCRGVVEESYKARVWIVSPTTLMATLNTVRAVLKDVRMREQASIIQAEVGKMMEDVLRLDQRVVKLETHFDHARRDLRRTARASPPSAPAPPSHSVIASAPNHASSNPSAHTSMMKPHPSALNPPKPCGASVWIALKCFPCSFRSSKPNMPGRPPMLWPASTT